MSFTIPNIQTVTNFSTGYDGQTVPDKVDWTALDAADNDAGVLSGCAVAAKTPTVMKVKVAAGIVIFAGKSVNVTASTTLTVTAASATDRRDIVSVNKTGTLAVTKGTACGTAGWARTSANLPPVKPTIPATSVILAEIYVVGTTTATNKTTVVAAKNLVDKRVTWAFQRTTVVKTAATFTSTATSAITALSMPLAPTATYAFDAEVYANNSASGSTGVAVAVVVPAGATLRYNVLSTPNSTATKVVTYVTNTASQSAMITASGFTGAIQLTGAVIMSTATGTLKIGLASQTGSTTAHGTATVNIGSNLIVSPL